MAKIISGHAMATELCRIFGQPPDRVESVAITVEAGSVARVEISRLVTDVEAQEVYTLFEYFKLCDRTEHKQYHPQGFSPDAVATDDISKLAQQALEQAEEEG